MPQTSPTDPASPLRRIAVVNPDLASNPTLAAIPQTTILYSPRGLPPGAQAVLGWGARKSGEKAVALAAAHGLPAIRAEEAFLKAARREDPALQLLLDETGGMHYDPRRPSCIDAALDAADTPAIRARARALMARIRQSGLSKVNARKDPSDLPDRPFVLVVDQVAGDASLRPSAGTPERFATMLAATRATWPDHLIVVRTHPDLHDRGKGGHYRDQQDGPDMIFHTGADHPAAWLHAAEHVVVVCSQMGFEALIHGTPVTCWGTPFYAGRGLTRDLGPQPGYMRRQVDLEQLVGAALIAAPFSLDPGTNAAGTPEAVAAHLCAHRAAVQADPESAHAVGFSPRKMDMLTHFMPATRWLSMEEAISESSAAVVAWGATDAPEPLKDRPCLRVEDGFIRSKGLGAALVPALSWSVDATGGIHYDPTRPSAIETAIAGYTGTDEQRNSAQALCERILAMGATKYNLPESAPSFDGLGKQVVLVVGQVEGDAALVHSPLQTNAELLAAARAAWPEAFLVYRPHPDVVAGLRPGDWKREARLADAVEPHAGTSALIASCDHVAVMTSQMGFEALLRGVPVTCFGTPFYAGWGLTDDRDPQAAALRQNRRGTRPIEALIWGALIVGARYASPLTGRLLEVGGALDLLAHMPRATPISPKRRAHARVADWLRRWNKKRA